MSETRQIILLNPPGKKQYFRDYYCSKVSKARYYYHPVDLIYLSGRLAQIGNVFIIDAIAEGMDHNQCLSKVKHITPDVIVFLSSAPSYHEDMDFISTVKSTFPTCKMVGTGDVFNEFRTRSLYDNKQLDAIFTDFSTPDIIQYLTNDKNDSHNIPNVIYRHHQQIVEGQEHHTRGDWRVPLPLWDKINLKAYHFPFGKKKPFASILTDFGCPYNCDFCPVSTLEYKLRPVNDVIEELKLLKGLGVKELYIRDQTFGINKSRTMELLEKMLSDDLKFSWTCLSRTDVLDKELLSLMKTAGCHTIMAGIESANDTLMTKHKKNITLKQSKENIIKIKKAGIKVSGFFMIGFPGESKESIQATAKLARTLPLDFASFNIVAPRFGTDFRQEAIKISIIDPNNLNTESSETLPIWKNQQISNNELLKLQKRAIRKFYFRPSFILKKILNIKSCTEMANLMREGIAMMVKNVNLRKPQ